jgi:[1-hydroxy-2-(trimethylamino)ethyl]phosphonate dioxygenase
MIKRRKGSMLINALFERLINQGAGRYGLSEISQFDHALQTAALAMEESAEGAFVLAALFHDIGHLVPETDVALAERGVDDRHEVVGARMVAAVFGPEVASPVRLHVEAKRYLCAREPDYLASLAPDSVQSLILQGGIMMDEEVQTFLALPGARQAIALRRIDDKAKIRGKRVPPLSEYCELAVHFARSA